MDYTEELLAKAAPSLRHVPGPHLLAGLPQRADEPWGTDPTQGSGGGVRAVKALATAGVKARISTDERYYFLRLSGRYVLKMAELCPEWRRALGGLAQKRNMQPKTPMLRRLLELAENPPRALTKH